MRSVERSPAGGCWTFTAGKTGAGYGLVGGKRDRRLAHVVSYEHHVGPIPEGLVVGHVCHDEASARGECAGGRTCPHRACVNPDHLAAMTYGQNSRGSSMTGSGPQERCKRGLHLMAEARRVVGKDRTPYCGACRDEYVKEASERRRLIEQGLAPLPTPRLAARRDTCKRGHDLADAYVRKNGTRQCRVCQREREERHRAKRKAA
ncbi:MAG: hypothetical protein K0R62_7487 [Nonomuraea muscovyensis]|jgi:hypothetical protein|nr:hypothetical protein [Nonomuraea muscovyensis]